MTFWEKLTQLLEAEMEVPTVYGWFHLLFLGLTILTTVLMCVYGKNHSPRRIRAIIFGTALTMLLLEFYKQIEYTFDYTDGGVTADFEWYAFPWQFCAMPMYVGLLAGLTKKGKLHDALCAFLATYSVFAGIAVMLYPETIFIETIGINIQASVHHGAMVVLGAYLLATGYVKLEHKTVLKALPVFVAGVVIAMILNEIAYFSGLLETDEFNMFFISPHCEPSLPVYSLVQEVLPYPWCLLVYVAGFTAAAYIILLLAMGIRYLAVKHHARRQDGSSVNASRIIAG